MGTVRLVLADDHPQVREGLRWLLTGKPGIEVVGEAADGAAALAVAAQERADMILMDLHMPGIGGIRALQQLQEMAWRPWVIIVTADADPDMVQAAEQEGARGFLLKTVHPGELIEAIQAVARGETRFIKQAPSL